MDGSKFVGGSALARKRAREFLRKNYVSKKQPKQKKCKSTSPHHNPHRLPNKISPADRFFASLLLSSNNDFAASINNNEKWGALMSDICNRAGVPLPSKLSLMGRDAQEFFATRSSLVLEEARCIITEKLSDHKVKRYGMGVKLLSTRIEQRKCGASLTFGKMGRNRNSHNSHSHSDALEPFTPSELCDMKPGCVVQVTGWDQSGREKSILTNIIPLRDFNECSVALIAYTYGNGNGNENDDLEIFCTESTRFRLTPITNLISEQRQFIACYDIKSLKKLGFLPKLMGVKRATHLRFDDSDGDGDGDVDVNNNLDDDAKDKGEDFDENLSDDANEEKKSCDYDEIPPGEIAVASIDIPSLNRTQEKAASSFIDDPSHDFSMVQGPPGTGKTTFMTAVLCRTFLKNRLPNKSSCAVNREKRVLVAAPTNKAITVLASRFIRAIIKCTDIGLNIILIGVEDALFPKDEVGVEADSTHRSLRSIFVYSWIDELIKDLETLRLNNLGSMSASETVETVQEVLLCADYLVQKMERGIPFLAKKYGALRHGKAFLKHMKVLWSKVSGDSSGDTVTLSDLTEDVALINEIHRNLISTIKEIQSGGDCVVSELLATANVIFVTLTSSGVSIMKRTRRIDELFIDEAAAATEPEIFIPLHLRPSRMLCVGDPKQLPASVTSQRAAKFGLDQSLLERLICGCDNDHVMLDVQYRMKPQICAFPNSNFYDGELNDGENVIRPDYKIKKSILNSDPYSFVQINGREARSGSGSYFNMDEARFVVNVVKHIRQTSCDKLWDSKDKLRVITFYSGQVRAIKDLLRPLGLGHVMVATVDSSQGCESDVVIVSFVRCQVKSSAVGGTRTGKCRVGFLNDHRRINVALTRAKFKLICVGDGENTLLKSDSPTVTSLAKNAMERKLLVSQDVL